MAERMLVLISLQTTSRHVSMNSEVQIQRSTWPSMLARSTTSVAAPLAHVHYFKLLLMYSRPDDEACMCSFRWTYAHAAANPVLGLKPPLCSTNKGMKPSAGA